LCGYFPLDLLELFQLSVIPVDEGRALEKVQWKVSAQAEFRKDHKPCSALICLRRKTQYARRIPCKIADSGIELSEGYFHA